MPEYIHKVHPQALRFIRTNTNTIHYRDTKVQVNQLCQDRAFNSFAICLAYESSANFKVKCKQVWLIIIISFYQVHVCGSFLSLVTFLNLDIKYFCSFF